MLDRWEKPPPYDNAVLVSLLKLATLYEMESVRNFAIYHLQSSRGVSSAMKIELARKYTVPEWIAPAFKVLLATGTPYISRADVNRLGLETYYILANAHAEIVEARARLSLVAPPIVHGDQCVDRRYCEVAWKEFWLTKITRWLVNPDDPPHIADIPDHIRTLLPVQSMGMQCQQATLTELEGMTVLRKEKLIGEMALQEVLDYHKSLEM